MLPRLLDSFIPRCAACSSNPGAGEGALGGGPWAVIGWATAEFREAVRKKRGADMVRPEADENSWEGN